MSQPNAISEKLAWASALVSCAFPQGHQRREYTSSEVVEYLSCILPTAFYNFSTSKEFMKAAFANRRFRNYITEFSEDLVSLDRRNGE